MAITGRKEALFTFYILKSSNLSTKSNGLLNSSLISSEEDRSTIQNDCHSHANQLELYKQNGQYT